MALLHTPTNNLEEIKFSMINCKIVNFERKNVNCKKYSVH